MVETVEPLEREGKAPGGEPWPVPWQPVLGKDNGIASHLHYFLLRAVLFVGARMPHGVMDAFGSALARVAYRLLPSRRKVAVEFLEQALGPLSKEERSRRVRQAWLHLFRVVIEAERFYRRVPLDRAREHFDVHFTPDARRALATEGGCVLITGHLGNWESLNVLAVALGLRSVYVVGKPPKNRPLSKAVQDRREHYRSRLLPRRGAMLAAPTIIKSGGTLGLVVDQRARLKPVYAPFFGRRARCDRSVGVLLRRFKVPVIPMAAYLTDQPLRYRVEFGDILWPEDLAGKDPVDIAVLINQTLEKMILADPDQYFWLHDRYRGGEDPEEGARETAVSAKGEAAPGSKEETP